MNFETQEEVTYNEYIKMIELKTGVMVAAAFNIGAMIAGASEEDANNLYEYGKNLGIAFQIKDDYLDVFGNEEVFGKKHAGDIYENKKTILYFIAKSKADQETLKELEYWYAIFTYAYLTLICIYIYIYVCVCVCVCVCARTRAYCNALNLPTTSATRRI